MDNEIRIKLIDAVAAALRSIGQPPIENLIFVCEEGSRFEKYDFLVGIPVYVVPFLSARGGLLLASTAKSYDWNSIGRKCLKFQEELEDLLPEEED